MILDISFPRIILVVDVMGGRWTGWEVVQVTQTCWKGAVLTEMRDELSQMLCGGRREEDGLKRS